MWSSPYRFTTPRGNSVHDSLTYLSLVFFILSLTSSLLCVFVVSAPAAVAPAFATAVAFFPAAGGTDAHPQQLPTPHDGSVRHSSLDGEP